MEKRQKKKGTKRKVLIYLLIVVIFYIAIYILPQVSDIFVETYHAEYGTLETTDEAECLFVRSEKLYYASNGGSVNRVAKQGRLMRIRSHIIDVGQTAYYSDMRGMVSYFYDGLESTYSPENMETVGINALETIQKSDENQVAETGQDTVASGDALFKIVDNQQWYLVCWIDEERAKGYEEGREILVDFHDGTEKKESTQLKMTVQSLTAQDKKVRVILSCNRYYKDFDRYRVKTCSLITSSTSGILIETDSIVEEDGKKGVYVVDKYGNYNFTPIQILDQDRDVTVVEKNYYYDAQGKYVQTVGNYYEILRPGADKAKPEKAEE